ncbi:hypothetical protein MD484_g7067, partial [Candolleomyces efflorescens]
MFPINDFNFVFCGIATVAATMGYAFTRKQEAGTNPPSPSEDDTQDSTVPLTEKVALQLTLPTHTSSCTLTSSASRRDSLKRKVPHDGFDEPTPDIGYPFNLANIYPHKRCKTPTSEPEQTPAAGPQVEPQTENTPSPIIQQVPELVSTTTSSNIDEKHSIAADGISSCVLQTLTPEPPRTPSPPPSNEAVPPETSAVAQEQPSTPAPPTRPATPVPATTPWFGSTSMSASKGFAAFAGEENEDVEQELKGVKLFVKRGNKPFSSGMIGHLKLLSDKSASTERLLFRREPLWQVSMNVKVNATVRCSYDAEENAVRLVLKEPVVSESTSSPKKDVPLELVVYALKPGRACSKQDFREFAESLLKNGQFQKAEHKASAAPSSSS